jgi:hypothetical protein
LATGIERAVDIDMPYLLFSQTNTTGSFQIAARLRASWKAPSFDAPSPKNTMQTWPERRIFALSPTPTAIGRPPPTMPLAPRLPPATSAMCIEPPRPRQ